MRGRSHLGDALKQRQILRMAAKRVIADQRRIGTAAERAVLVFVDLFEEQAHVMVDSRFQVFQQLFLLDVQQAQLQPRARLGAIDHVVQARPRRLQRLEFRSMHDCIQLIRQQAVDFRHPLIDHRHHRLVRAGAHAFVQYLGRQLSQQLLGIGVLRRLHRHVAFLHDAVQQAEFLRLRRFLRCITANCRRIGRLFACHVRHPEVEIARWHNRCRAPVTPPAPALPAQPSRPPGPRS